MTYSRIVGSGGYLPQKVLTNADLEKMVDTSDTWITERTGIHTRHIAAPDETTCDMAEQAARGAIQAAGLTPTDIDLIIVATTTPDQVFPSTACLLQHRLGIQGPAAFDVQAVCTGFIYAMAVADKFIKSGAAVNALVVGADVLSRITDWTDRRTCVLFGDGAGAVVLRADNTPGILSTHLHADGRYSHLLCVPPGQAYLHMQGNEVFRIAVNTLGRIADEVITSNRLEKSDIDWLIPHQANIRIIQAAAKKLSMPMDRVVVTVGQHGNTSAASVPLALDVAVRDGRVRPGDTLLFEAFGGGFTWGAALARY